MPIYAAKDYRIVDQGDYDPDARYEVVRPNGATVGFWPTKREAKKAITDDIKEQAHAEGISL